MLVGKKDFGQKKFWLKKKCWSKKIWEKQILVKKKIWSKKNFGQQKFCPPKIFGQNKYTNYLIGLKNNNKALMDTSQSMAPELANATEELIKEVQAEENK